MKFFRKFYIDPDIQLPLIVVLIFLVTVEGLFVGWGFYKAIIITKQWDRPHQTLDFFIAVAVTVTSIVIVNFLLGTYLSYKIAGPILKIRKIMGEITRGNLEKEASLRQGDFLLSCVLDLNKMIQTLKSLIYRDRQYVSEVNGLLNDCQKNISQTNSMKVKERKELDKLLNMAKSKLSVVNIHFTKGKGDQG